jgi:hypothetical protein
MTRLTFHVVLPSVLLVALCHADPAAPNAVKTAPPTAKVSASSPLQALSGLGKGPETEKSLENSLVSRLKKRDPFQLPIRGKYRGVVEPVEQPAQQVAQAPVTTFAQAIDHLPVRGIDPASRELLIGSRCLTEGDLLKIEFNGQPFTAWVRSVGKEGATFVNGELTETVQKTIVSGPRDLDAADSIRSLLPPAANRQSFSNSELIPVSEQESGRASAPARQGRLQADQQDVYRLQDYPINELFEFLARKAGLQYFFNPGVDNVRVTGELSRQLDPMESMQELALQYDLAVYQRGHTIYVITPAQNF